MMQQVPPISRTAAVIAPGLVMASPVNGASMNPARTFGPDVVANDYTGWWLYIAGPFIGATVAVMIIGLLRGLPDKGEIEGAEVGALPLAR